MKESSFIFGAICVMTIIQCLILGFAFWGHKNEDTCGKYEEEKKRNVPIVCLKGDLELEAAMNNTFSL